MAEVRLIDANALLKEIEDWHDSLGGTMNPADWGIQNVLQSVMDNIIEAEDVDAVPVVWCRDCAFFRERHVRTEDGQMKSYDEFPPEAFSRLGTGDVTSEYGINVGSQCMVDCNKGYGEDKTVFRQPDDYCSRGVRKMDGGASGG